MITKRRYRLLGDFHKVCQFIDDNFTMDTLNSYLLRPFYEYAHTHPAFKHKLTHRFGLWEDGDELVAIACYEMDLGECFISVKQGNEDLIPKILSYAETELAVIDGDEVKLGVWVVSTESDKIDILSSRGYKKVYTEPVTMFSYDKELPEAELPEGFSIINLQEENDVKKINDCLWKGFGHGDEPDDDFDCRLLMQSGPNFNKELTTIIKAPNGEYACFAGMWLNEANEFAYVEPLATVPKYRGMGLATVAIAEGMRKTKNLGAKFCFGGAVDFYEKIGFEKICHRELWGKKWNK